MSLPVGTRMPHTETTQKRKTHQHISAANYHTTAKNAGVLYTKDPTTEAPQSPPRQALCIRPSASGDRKAGWR